MVKNYNKLSLEDGLWAKEVAELENAIVCEAEYLMGTSIRHPCNNDKSVKRAFNSARYRSKILEYHSAITRAALNDVHSVLDKLPKRNW